MIRLELPYHLRTLGHIEGEVRLEMADSGEAPTIRSVLDAIEARYPMLRGTIRDRSTGERRPMIRFYACEQDLSNQPPDTPLPAAVAAGTEPLLVIGAIAGG